MKILIVDDEPLVLAGIRSMLDRALPDEEICGSAMNGQAALQLIEETAPDIVMTDIKMPVMSGLELIRICRENYGSRCPSFIILTSYEDFHMVKEALTYQVSDYLIKLELTPENLREAIERVAQRMTETAQPARESAQGIYAYHDKFFICLLHNLFESEEQFLLQSNDLNLDFHYAGYLCCYGELCNSQADTLPMDKQLSLFGSSLQMIRELVVKYRSCYVTSLDLRHFALIFCYEETELTRPEELHTILCNISETLQKYYNVTLRCGIGTRADSAFQITDSYQHARQAFRQTVELSPIVCYDELHIDDEPHSSFNISLFKNDLTRAFEEYDSELLTATIRTICELFTGHPDNYVQALDAAGNILYLSISLLQNGEAQVSELFPETPEGYRSLYRQSTVEQVMLWLRSFGDRLCGLFESHRRDYKNRIVTNVKKYVQEHVRERLSLNEVAAVFGISPSYLSQLFGKYSDAGYVEYVNSCKIREGKRLLDEGSLKIYEVAEQLGFESAFYFSKVFKKIEGISPTEYLNR